MDPGGPLLDVEFTKEARGFANRRYTFVLMSYGLPGLPRNPHELTLRAISFACQGLSASPRLLTEKTVELNFTANILGDLRRTINPRAYAYGFSLTYEGQTGLDSTIEAPGGAQLLGLQLKRAKDRPALNVHGFKTEHIPVGPVSYWPDQ